MEGSADGVHGVIPLFLRGGMVREEGVADGDATQVQADNFWVGRTKGIDDLQTSSSKVDMEARFLLPGEFSGRKGDQASLFMSRKERNLFSKDTGGGKEERFCVFGASQGSGTDSDNLSRVKGTNLSLEEGDLAKGAAAGGGLNATGKGDSFPEANGVGFFVMEAESSSRLFGKQQLESVGAKIEDGAAKREFSHM